MALNIPSNLYSGGAQVFNNAPHLAFQARLLQQKFAKEEAMDSYYKRLPLMINEKGVRDQERPRISESMLGIKNYYIQNKDRIRKGDQAAMYNYEKMVREHQDLVGKSQAAGLTDLQVGKLRFNPSTEYMFQGSETMEKLRRQHLPIDDPEHEDLDLDIFTAAPKPYDRDKYFKSFSTLKGNDNLIPVKNPDGITETIFNKPTYGESQKEYVLQVAADKYLHDPSFKLMVDSDLGAPDATNPLNSDFKEQYGHDIQTPIDLATAYTFAGLKPIPITQKIQKDIGAYLDKTTQIAKEKAAQQDWYVRRRQLLTHGYSKALVDYKSVTSAKQGEGVLNKFIDTIYEAGTDRIKSSTGTASTIQGVTIDGKVYKGRIVSIPLSAQKDFAIYDAEGNGTLPDATFLSEDKKTFIPLKIGEKTPTGTNYQIKSTSKPVPIELLKVSLGKALLTKTQMGGEVVDELGEGEDAEYIPPLKITKTEKKTSSQSTKSSSGVQWK